MREVLLYLVLGVQSYGSPSFFQKLSVKQQRKFISSLGFIKYLLLSKRENKSDRKILLKNLKRLLKHFHFNKPSCELKYSSLLVTTSFTHFLVDLDMAIIF